MRVEEAFRVVFDLVFFFVVVEETDQVEVGEFVVNNADVVDLLFLFLTVDILDKTSWREFLFEKSVTMVPLGIG